MNIFTEAPPRVKTHRASSSLLCGGDNIQPHLRHYTYSHTRDTTLTSRVCFTAVQLGISSKSARNLDGVRIENPTPCAHIKPKTTSAPAHMFLCLCRAASGFTLRARAHTEKRTQTALPYYTLNPVVYGVFEINSIAVSLAQHYA